MRGGLSQTADEKIRARNPFVFEGSGEGLDQKTLGQRAVFDLTQRAEPLENKEVVE
jgi:hypothetical protein